MSSSSCLFEFDTTLPPPQSYVAVKHSSLIDVPPVEPTWRAYARKLCGTDAGRATCCAPTRASAAQGLLHAAGWGTAGASAGSSHSAGNVMSPSPDGTRLAVASRHAGHLSLFDTRDGYSSRRILTGVAIVGTGASHGAAGAGARNEDAGAATSLLVLWTPDSRFCVILQAAAPSQAGREGEDEDEGEEEASQRDVDEFGPLEFSLQVVDAVSAQVLALLSTSGGIPVQSAGDGVSLLASATASLERAQDVWRSMCPRQGEGTWADACVLSGVMVEGGGSGAVGLEGGSGARGALQALFSSFTSTYRLTLLMACYACKGVEDGARPHLRILQLDIPVPLPDVMQSALDEARCTHALSSCTLIRHAMDIALKGVPFTWSAQASTELVGMYGSAPTSHGARVLAAVDLGSYLSSVTSMAAFTVHGAQGVQGVAVAGQVGAGDDSTQVEGREGRGGWHGILPIAIRLDSASGESLVFPLQRQAAVPLGGPLRWMQFDTRQGHHGLVIPPYPPFHDVQVELENSLAREKRALARSQGVRARMRAALVALGRAFKCRGRPNAYAALHPFNGFAVQGEGMGVSEEGEVLRLPLLPSHPDAGLLHSLTVQTLPPAPCSKGSAWCLAVQGSPACALLLGLTAEGSAVIAAVCTKAGEGGCGVRVLARFMPCDVQPRGKDSGDGNALSTLGGQAAFVSGRWLSSACHFCLTDSAGSLFLLRIDTCPIAAADGTSLDEGSTGEEVPLLSSQLGMRLRGAALHPDQPGLTALSRPSSTSPVPHTLPVHTIKVWSSTQRATPTHEFSTSSALANTGPIRMDRTAEFVEQTRKLRSALSDAGVDDTATAPEHGHGHGPLTASSTMLSILFSSSVSMPGDEEGDGECGPEVEPAPAQLEQHTVFTLTLARTVWTRRGVGTCSLLRVTLAPVRLRVQQRLQSTSPLAHTDACALSALLVEAMAGARGEGVEGTDQAKGALRRLKDCVWARAAVDSLRSAHTVNVGGAGGDRTGTPHSTAVVDAVALAACADCCDKLDQQSPDALLVAAALRLAIVNGPALTTIFLHSSQLFRSTPALLLNLPLPLPLDPTAIMAWAHKGVVAARQLAMFTRVSLTGTLQGQGGELWKASYAALACIAQLSALRACERSALRARLAAVRSVHDHAHVCCGVEAAWINRSSLGSIAQGFACGSVPGRAHVPGSGCDALSLGTLLCDTHAHAAGEGQQGLFSARLRILDLLPPSTLPASYASLLSRRPSALCSEADPEETLLGCLQEAGAGEDDGGLSACAAGSIVYAARTQLAGKRAAARAAIAAIEGEGAALAQALCSAVSRDEQRDSVDVGVDPPAAPRGCDSDSEPGRDGAGVALWLLRRAIWLGDLLPGDVEMCRTAAGVACLALKEASREGVLNGQVEGEVVLQCAEVAVDAQELAGLLDGGVSSLTPAGFPWSLSWWKGLSSRQRVMRALETGEPGDTPDICRACLRLRLVPSQEPLATLLPSSVRTQRTAIPWPALLAESLLACLSLSTAPLGIDMESGCIAGPAASLPAPALCACVATAHAQSLSLLRTMSILTAESCAAHMAHTQRTNDAAQSGLGVEVAARMALQASHSQPFLGVCGDHQDAMLSMLGSLGCDGGDGDGHEPTPALTPLSDNDVVTAMRPALCAVALAVRSARAVARMNAGAVPWPREGHREEVGLHSWLWLTPSPSLAPVWVSVAQCGRAADALAMQEGSPLASAAVDGAAALFVRLACTAAAARAAHRAVLRESARIERGRGQSRGDGAHAAAEKASFRQALRARDISKATAAAGQHLKRFMSSHEGECLEGGVGAASPSTPHPALPHVVLLQPLDWEQATLDTLALLCSLLPSMSVAQSAADDGWPDVEDADGMVGVLPATALHCAARVYTGVLRSIACVTGLQDNRLVHVVGQQLPIPMPRPIHSAVTPATLCFTWRSEAEVVETARRIVDAVCGASVPPLSPPPAARARSVSSTSTSSSLPSLTAGLQDLIYGTGEEEGGRRWIPAPASALESGLLLAVTALVDGCGPLAPPPSPQPALDARTGLSLARALLTGVLPAATPAVMGEGRFVEAADVMAGLLAAGGGTVSGTLAGLTPGQLRMLVRHDPWGVIDSLLAAVPWVYRGEGEEGGGRGTRHKGVAHPHAPPSPSPAYSYSLAMHPPPLLHAGLREALANGSFDAAARVTAWDRPMPAASAGLPYSPQPAREGGGGAVDGTPPRPTGAPSTGLEGGQGDPAHALTAAALGAMASAWGFFATVAEGALPTPTPTRGPSYFDSSFVGVRRGGDGSTPSPPPLTAAPGAVPIPPSTLFTLGWASFASRCEAYGQATYTPTRAVQGGAGAHNILRVTSQRDEGEGDGLALFRLTLPPACAPANRLRPRGIRVLRLCEALGVDMTATAGDGSGMSGRQRVRLALARAAVALKDHAAAAELVGELLAPLLAPTRSGDGGSLGHALTPLLTALALDDECELLDVRAFFAAVVLTLPLTSPPVGVDIARLACVWSAMHARGTSEACGMDGLAWPTAAELASRCPLVLGSAPCGSPPSSLSSSLSVGLERAACAAQCPPPDAEEVGLGRTAAAVLLLMGTGQGRGGGGGVRLPCLALANSAARTSVHACAAYMRALPTDQAVAACDTMYTVLMDAAHAAVNEPAGVGAAARTAWHAADSTLTSLLSLIHLVSMVLDGGGGGGAHTVTHRLRRCSYVSNMSHHASSLLDRICRLHSRACLLPAPRSDPRALLACMAHDKEAAAHVLRSLHSAVLGHGSLQQQLGLARALTSPPTPGRASLELQPYAWFPLPTLSPLDVCRAVTVAGVAVAMGGVAVSGLAATLLTALEAAGFALDECVHEGADEFRVALVGAVLCSEPCGSRECVAMAGWWGGGEQRQSEAILELVEACDALPLAPPYTSCPDWSSLLWLGTGCMALPLPQLPSLHPHLTALHGAALRRVQDREVDLPLPRCMWVLLPPLDRAVQGEHEAIAQCAARLAAFVAEDVNPSCPGPDLSRLCHAVCRAWGALSPHPPPHHLILPLALHPSRLHEAVVEVALASGGINRGVVWIRAGGIDEAGLARLIAACSLLLASVCGTDASLPRYAGPTAMDVLDAVAAALTEQGTSAHQDELIAWVRLEQALHTAHTHLHGAPARALFLAALAPALTTTWQGLLGSGVGRGVADDAHLAFMTGEDWQDRHSSSSSGDWPLHSAPLYLFNSCREALTTALTAMAQREAGGEGTLAQAGDTQAHAAFACSVYQVACVCRGESPPPPPAPACVALFQGETLKALQRGDDEGHARLSRLLGVLRSDISHPSSLALSACLDSIRATQEGPHWPALLAVLRSAGLATPADEAAGARQALHVILDTGTGPALQDGPDWPWGRLSRSAVYPESEGLDAGSVVAHAVRLLRGGQGGSDATPLPTPDPLGPALVRAATVACLLVHADNLRRLGCGMSLPSTPPPPPPADTFALPAMWGQEAAATLGGVLGSACLALDRSRMQVHALGAPPLVPAPPTISLSPDSAAAWEGLLRYLLITLARRGVGDGEGGGGLTAGLNALRLAVLIRGGRAAAAAIPHLPPGEPGLGLPPALQALLEETVSGHLAGAALSEGGELALFRAVRQLEMEAETVARKSAQCDGARTSLAFLCATATIGFTSSVPQLRKDAAGAVARGVRVGLCRDLSLPPPLWSLACALAPSVLLEHAVEEAAAARRGGTGGPGMADSDSHDIGAGMATSRPLAREIAACSSAAWAAAYDALTRPQRMGDADGPSLPPFAATLPAWLAFLACSEALDVAAELSRCETRLIRLPASALDPAAFNAVCGGHVRGRVDVRMRAWQQCVSVRHVLAGTLRSLAALQGGAGEGAGWSPSLVPPLLMSALASVDRTTAGLVVEQQGEEGEEEAAPPPVHGGLLGFGRLASFALGTLHAVAPSVSRAVKGGLESAQVGMARVARAAMEEGGWGGGGTFPRGRSASPMRSPPPATAPMDPDGWGEEEELQLDADSLPAQGQEESPVPAPAPADANGWGDELDLGLDLADLDVPPPPTSALQAGDGWGQGMDLDLGLECDLHTTGEDKACTSSPIATLPPLSGVRLLPLGTSQVYSPEGAEGHSREGYTSNVGGTVAGYGSAAMSLPTSPAQAGQAPAWSGGAAQHAFAVSLPVPAAPAALSCDGWGMEGEEDLLVDVRGGEGQGGDTGEVPDRVVCCAHSIAAALTAAAMHAALPLSGPSLPSLSHTGDSDSEDSLADLMPGGTGRRPHAVSDTDLVGDLSPYSTLPRSLSTPSVGTRGGGAMAGDLTAGDIWGALDARIPLAKLGHERSAK